MASFGERVIGALRLDANTFEEIERDPTAIGQAVGVIALAAVSTGLGNIFWGGITGVLSNTIISLISYGVWAVMVWLIGTKLMPDPATKADLPETFRVIGFAAAPGILGIVTIIPILGWLLMFVLWIWSIAAMVVAVKAVLDYPDYTKPVIVVLIAFAIQFIVSMMLMAMAFGTAMIGGMMQPS
jgi:Yip1-like protein